MFCKMTKVCILAQIIYIYKSMSQSPSITILKPLHGDYWSLRHGNQSVCISFRGSLENLVLGVRIDDKLDAIDPDPTRRMQLTKGDLGLGLLESAVCNTSTGSGVPCHCMAKLQVSSVAVWSGMPPCFIASSHCSFPPLTMMRLIACPVGTSTQQARTAEAGTSSSSCSWCVCVCVCV